MSWYRELRHWLRAALGICLHERQPLLRRGADHRMGFECPDCGRWSPFDLDPSPLAQQLARRESWRKSRRHARPLVISARRLESLLGVRPVFRPASSPLPLRDGERSRTVPEKEQSE